MLIIPIMLVQFSSFDQHHTGRIYVSNLTELLQNLIKVPSEKSDALAHKSVQVMIISRQLVTFNVKQYDAERKKQATTHMQLADMR